ncbi:restriction endonuclease subunit S [Glutamicibacter sp. NPDC087344]|uniref:restriction endonuclease subunit S n=1 Tax=Glutamicibacter sp. NPDC087344 TaxID=3363994 RepID=UPI003810B170
MKMQRVPLIDFFEIKSSLQDDKINFTDADINDVDSLPFVSRTARNNGVTAYCETVAEKVNSGGVITLALDGSTGSTFYQHHSFLSGQNIWLLIPNKDRIGELTPQIALYLIASIRKAVSSYTYNLSLTKTRLNKIQLILPLTIDSKLDRKAVVDAMSQVRHVELIEEVPEERYQILT